MYGLTDKEVIEARKQFGSNSIEKTSKHGFMSLLISSLGDPIIKILLIALGIKSIFLIQYFDWFETIGIVIAIFLASFISSISEYGSEKAFAKLQEETSKIKCKVKRNRRLVLIPIDEIVVGDVIKLETGDKVPADGIIIDGILDIDESSLNGEAKEQTRTKGDKVYRGTVIYSKQGLFKVTSVGINTYYGKIAETLQEKPQESPLKLRLRVLARTISRIGYISAFLVAISYLFSVIVINNNFDIVKITETITNIPLITSYLLYSLTLSVTIIVVAVPEGLPMMITLVLSSNMKRMLKNNVLVRKLVGIETAGSLNILFTDKTGTLTEGKMTVTKIVTGSLEEAKIKTKYYTILKEAILYNNESIYSNNEVIGGNITDQALLKYIKPEPLLYKKENVVPFDSKNKYASVVVRNTRYIKGAPEKLLPYCKKYYDLSGNTRYITKNINNYIESENSKGARTLLIACNDKNDDTFNNLVLIGIISIKDKIRKEAIEGIKEVTSAGIQTIMITGDNLITARSIANELNLLQNDDLAITSTELSKMSDEELKIKLPHIKVIARMLPQDKVRLVNICLELNLVVGMTGDGVNDAPALKKADVGFAMGSGTEVAKEASDIVILDDNFKSIASSVLFGRTIFKNIRKFIIFQLTMNISAVGLSILGPFIGVDTPVTVIQMLWINMVMDTLAGIAFSYEAPLKEYMRELPKKKNEPILNKYMINQITVTGIYSCILSVLFLKCPLIKHIFNTETALMTAFFGLFIFSGIFNSFNARTHRLHLLAHLFKNRIFIITIMFIIIVQFFLLYFGGSLFRTTYLSAEQLGIMLLLAATVIPLDQGRKIYLRIKGIKDGV